MDKVHLIVALNHERKRRSDTLLRTSSYMDDARERCARAWSALTTRASNTTQAVPVSSP
jgi:hypothetical protein